MSDPRVLASLRRYGRDATSFQTAKSGFSYWFADHDAFVAFVDVGGIRVVAGAPVAAPERIADVATAFVRDAAESGHGVCFFGVEQDFVDATSYPALLVGLQPVWDPSSWSATLSAAPRLREQLRRARAKKVRVRSVTAAEARSEPLARQIHDIGERWLGLRGMAPMGFVVRVEPHALLEEKTVFVAEREGVMVGMVALAPLYARGFLIEDLFRDPRGPNGTTELLIDAAMNEAARRGSRYVTLGLAPLAGDVSPAFRLFRDHASILFDFRGLEAFKRRLRPDHLDAIYIVRSPGISSLRAIVAVLRAFAHGSFIRFGLQTLRRGPPIAIWILAIALVPWTIGLASVDGEKWFSSTASQRAWTVFDVLLAIGMLMLAVRWRARLALSLAIIVTADAVVTTLEALFFGAPRIHTALDALLVVAASIAPASAAVVLWGSWRRRRA